MTREKKGDFSEKTVTIFLILAICISLISLWTVVLSINQNTSSQPQNEVQQKSTSTVGVIGFTILIPEGITNNETNTTALK